MKVLILAGGKGVRLRPLTNKIPKSMIKIAGRPILEWQILILKKFGIDKIVLSTGYLSEKIEKYFKDGSKFDVNITYSKETEALGTAGAVKLARKHFKKRFLLIYGDIFFTINPMEVVNFHDSKNAFATLVAHKSTHPHDSDLLELRGTRIVKIHIKPNPNPVSEISKTSLYVLEPEIFKYLPSKGNLEKLLPSLLYKPIHAYFTDAFIMDVGTFDRIRMFEKIAKDVIKFI